MIEEALESVYAEIKTQRQDIANEIANFDVDLPTLPKPETVPDDGNWLFDSNRSYLEQLDYYKERKAANTE
ncbi:hypothetical protein [Candidatus Magnetominusculus dajiuhuensis]|uniref:hypothetical protein n=1 Tax=Candidatus Magnetominusculus dajiuhuensis TaxID=3137712 RepID=UPI003B42BA47